MILHEYQGKEILQKYGLKIPYGILARTPEEAVEAAQKIKEITQTTKFVLKAQLHAGGRGKAGGIKIANSIQEVREKALDLIGKKLVTPQTGPQGKVVSKILVTEDAYPPPINENKEMYLSILIDRSAEKYVILFSEEGGVEIEELSKTHPQKIKKIYVNPLEGLRDYHVRKIFYFTSLPENLYSEFSSTIKGIYQAFIETNASLIEVNPFLKNSRGEFVIVDCKYILEDNGLIKNPDLIKLRDIEEEDPIEVEANSIGLSFVKLNGNIACMVNGAGLAMATMDMIKLYGGEPANFLDVGGTADVSRIEKGFEILLKYPGIKAIFVNIFGGIVRCDRVAQGIINAYKKNPNISTPLIVRFLGTNADIAKQMLIDNHINVSFIDDFTKASQTIKALVSNN